MASSLPEELVQEILVRASLVCKAWRRVLLNRGCFLRRCREFHDGGAPPLLGYIRTRYRNGEPMGFELSATSNASPLRMPAVDFCSSDWHALDCRHGRVLCLCIKGDLSKHLVVWDPITGSQQHLSVPPYYKTSSSTYSYAGAAVLCAEDEGCDHLDCHGGPFMVVIVEAKSAIAETTIFTWARIYSSKTGEWSVPTSISINKHWCCQIYSTVDKQSLLIGDTLYFYFESGKRVIIKYDLNGHWLSEIDLPQDDVNGVVTLMMNKDGGLEFVTLLNNCVYLWSRQDVTNGVGGWVQNRVMDIETLAPRPIKFENYDVIGFVEGTNTICINMSAGVFMLDIKSKTLRRFGETDNYHIAYPILPYVSFYAPR